MKRNKHWVWMGMILAGLLIAGLACTQPDKKKERTYTEEEIEKELREGSGSYRN